MGSQESRATYQVDPSAVACSSTRRQTLLWDQLLHCLLMSSHICLVLESSAFPTKPSKECVLLSFYFILKKKEVKYMAEMEI